ncbi:hypothetical protein Clacol_002764 [Clathrus columnatus]|uniref:MARVEL domain-containing protein n=1 Tax=Clathrus columnatus TaxID=1419009 RepID=A0AAV5A6B1_9AGAM|nr:hypothetical protein Clacol_002764 [Clathrus columnatus]
MALIDSIKDAVTKVIPQKEFMPPPGGTLVHEEDMIISKPTILCFSGSTFFAFLAMCCFASVAAFQAKFGVGPSGLSGFAIFVAVASLLLAAFMLSIPVIYDKYDRFIRLARALQEPRVDFILTVTGLFFTFLISLITTISAWTEPGCKDPNKDPHASKGESFKNGLSGWCSTKKAGAIFFWFATICWIGSIIILILDWRAGRTGLRRDPAFNPPPRMHLHEVGGDEEDEEASVYGPSSVHAASVPAMPTSTMMPSSPFGDEYRYRPEPETRPRASMDTYGAFSDPTPQGYGSPISPGVSRTMQYADPYAAVRANISNPSSHPAPPYDYQRMVDSEEEEYCASRSPVRRQHEIQKRSDFEGNAPSRGLLTNVLSYVSREINDFVVSATGRVETSSSSRDCKHSTHSRSATASEGDVLRYNTHHHNTPSPPAAQQLKQFNQEFQYTELLQGSPESEGEDQEAYFVTSSLPTSLASNYPKHQKGSLISMPGSLFPRSPTPEIACNQRHVRFASDVRSPLPRPKHPRPKKPPPFELVEAPYIDLTQDLNQSEERTLLESYPGEDCKSRMTKEVVDSITSLPTSTGTATNRHDSSIRRVEASGEVSAVTSSSGQPLETSQLRLEERSVPLHNIKSVRDVVADIDASSSPKSRSSWEMKEKWKAVDQPFVRIENPSHHAVSHSSNTTDFSRDSYYVLETSTSSKRGIEGRRLSFDTNHTQQYIRELEGRIKMLEDELAKRSPQPAHPPPPPPPPPPPSLSNSFGRIPLSGSHPSVQSGLNIATNPGSHWFTKVSALKRKFLDNSQSSNTSTSFSFNGVSHNGILSHPRTANRVHGPTTSVDALGATPSLCSDNDNDTEDRVPMTPPLPPASQSSTFPSQSTRSFPSMTDVSERSEFASNRVTKDAAQTKAGLPVGASNNASSRLLATANDGNSPFSHRKPSSPLPPETPRRPRPPARIHKLRVSPKQTISDCLQDKSIDRSISFCPPNESTPAVSTTGNRLVRRKRLTLEDEIRNASSDYGSEELALQENYQSELTYDEEEQLVAALEHGTLVGMGQRDSEKGFISHGGGGGAPVLDPLVGDLPEPTKTKKKGRTTSTRGRRKSKRA